VRFLVDANILREPTKQAPAVAVVAWLRTNERDLAVNPIILGELEYGILLLPQGRRRARLERWFAQGLERLRILDFGAATASAWARLLARLKKRAWPCPSKIASSRRRRSSMDLSWSLGTSPISEWLAFPW
jgi:predicted nucleic acid-binding protein